jgi:FkbM family methyltransferase
MVTVERLTDVEVTLRALLEDAKFKFVDIGARGPMTTQSMALAPYAELFACEPDDEEADRLAETLREQAPWRRIEIIREAMAAQEGSATLFVTAQPGLSSLLRPNPDIADRYPVADAFRVVSEVTVPTLPLDAAAVRYGFEDACFLKIDTQGTELEILQSGDRLVTEATLGVYVEANFHPFYTGQSLFADIDAHLRSRGFALFELSRSLIRANNYLPELYSRRQVVWSHCLYLLDPADVFSGDRRAVPERAARYLGLLLAFEYFDLAIQLATTGATRKLFSRTFGRQLGRDLLDHVERETARRLGEGPRDPGVPLLEPIYKDARGG